MMFGHSIDSLLCERRHDLPAVFQITLLTVRNKLLVSGEKFDSIKRMKEQN